MNLSRALLLYKQKRQLITGVRRFSDSESCLIFAFSISIPCIFPLQKTINKSVVDFRKEYSSHKTLLFAKKNVAKELCNNENYANE